MRWHVACAAFLCCLAASGSSAGAAVYVADVEADAVHQFAAGSSGALTPLVPATVPLANPLAVASTQDGRHVFVAQLLESEGADQVAQFDVDASGRLVSSSAPVAAGSFPVAIAISPDGRSAYVANAGSRDLSIYDIRDGRLAEKPAALPISGQPVDVVVAHDGRSVFVVDAELDSVRQYNRGADGSLTPKALTSTAGGTAARGITLFPGQPFGALATNELLVLAVHPDNGIVSHYPRPDGPYAAVAAGIDGRSVYGAYGEIAAIGQFNVFGNGQTLPKDQGVYTPTKALALTLSGNGRSLYGVLEDRVAQYDVGASDGRLTAKSPPDLAIPGAVAIATTPNQAPIAALTATVSSTGEPSTFDASGSTDADGVVARYDWTFDDGTVLKDAGPKPTHVFEKAGDHLVTVTVADEGGCSLTALSDGHVTLCNGGPSARAALVASVTTRPLRLSNVRVSKRWRIAPRASSPSGGTVISWEQTRVAPTTVGFERIISGRRVGNRCVAPTKRNRRRRGCTRLVRIYTAAAPGARGANSRRFVGWSLPPAELGPFKPGRYLVTVTTADGGERAVARAKTTVLAAKP